MEETVPKREVRDEASSSDEDDEASEMEAKIREAFADYHLSRFAFMGVMKWVKMMSDPARLDLSRLRSWVLGKVNHKAKAKPACKWQMRSPELLPQLRTAGFWVSSGMQPVKVEVDGGDEKKGGWMDAVRDLPLRSADVDEVVASIRTSVHDLDKFLSSQPLSFDRTYLLPSLHTSLVQTFATVVRMLESSHEQIKQELFALRPSPPSSTSSGGGGGASGFQPYRNPKNTAVGEGLQPEDGIGTKSHDAGAWNVYYLYLHNVAFAQHCDKCPRTAELVRKVGEELSAVCDRVGGEGGGEGKGEREGKGEGTTASRDYHHAFFSALTPGSHIMKHNGPTNKKLRLHLPLSGNNGSVMRVGDEFICPKEGKVFIFDDSYEHEAWHFGDSTRLVLILDLWHPDLSSKEVRFLDNIMKSKMRAEKQYSEETNEDETLYGVLRRMEELQTDDWWQ